MALDRAFGAPAIGKRSSLSLDPCLSIAEVIDATLFLNFFPTNKVACLINSVTLHLSDIMFSS